MTKTPLFPLGKLVATPGALEVLAASNQTPTDFLGRHVRGDWGDLSAGDRQINDEAITEGSRIFSAYRTATGAKIWIITEADRSVTTILLPGDY
jgi:hypothetical protein